MKQTILLIGLIGILIVGCTEESIKPFQNPEVNTVEDIKKLKAEGKPISEMDKCMKEANKRTIYMNECYEGDKDDYNECMDNMPKEYSITLMDCLALT